MGLGRAMVRKSSYGGGSNWDVSTLSFVNSFTLPSGQPQGVFLKSDGLKMYYTSNVSNSIYEFDLGTAWDITTCVLNNTFVFTTWDTIGGGVSFKPDGTKMYMSAYNTLRVIEWDLSVSWDISTATFVQVFNLPTRPIGMYFRQDGLKLYFVSLNTDSIYEWDLSVSWDISTATFVQNLSISAYDSVPVDVHFKPDGTKMFLIGGNDDDINEFNLSIAWDISTATFIQSELILSSSPQGVYMKTDGFKVYSANNTNGRIDEFNMS